MIVKAQISIASSDGIASVYIYNKERNKQCMENASKEIIGAMDGKDKKFFYAKVRRGNFVIGKEAPWQDW